MRLLHTFAEEGPGPFSQIIPRRAVRGILWQGDTLAMIQSRRYGDYKFLGGGIEEGEDHPAALAREVREEGGLTLLPDTMRPYGLVAERRPAREPGVLLEQLSYYYLCRAGSQVGPTHQDDYERDYGYRLVFVRPRAAWEANSRLLAVGDVPPWTRRDNWVLARLMNEAEGGPTP